MTPAFNEIENVRKYLASVDSQKYSNLTAYIVDNGRNEGIDELAEPLGDRVVVLKGSPSQWWAAGTNAGTRRALEDGCDYIFTINIDVTLRPDTLANAVAVAANHPGRLIGITVCLQKDPDYAWYCGAKFVPATGDIDHFHGPLSQFSGQKIRESEWLTGMGVLIPAEVFKEVGMYDEKTFPQYFADADFSLRSKQAGHQLLVTTEAIALVDDTSAWIVRQRRHPHLRLFYDFFFSIRSQYNFKHRAAFYKRHWPGPYRQALRRFYFGPAREMLWDLLKRWVKYQGKRMLGKA